MKRWLFGIWLAIIAVSFCGCFLEPAESLYAVPKQSADYYNLQSAIDEAMQDGVNYCPPVSGENQQTVQLADLDGDGVDEAIVYVKGTGDAPLGVYVFDKQGDYFSLIARIEGAGSTFDHVMYVQVDDTPGYEIVLGRQIGADLPQLLGVYALRKGVLTELMSTDYSEFMTADLDDDGRQEIFVLRSGGDAQNGIAELYRWRDGQLNREREAALSTGVSSVKRMISGYMSRNVPAVFVASEYGESGIVTDIFAFRDGVFTNVSRSDETGISVQTVRDYYVYGCDIDDDGLIELPRIQSLPALPGDDSSLNQSLIRWYNLQPNGSEREKLVTYHNFSGSWYLVIPSGWEEYLMVTRSVAADNVAGYRFLWFDGESAEELLTIATLNNAEILEELAQEDWQLLTQQGDVLYACHIGAVGIARGVTVEALKEQFQFIRLDWKTGDIAIP